MHSSDLTLFWLAAAAFASMASMRIADPMLPVLAAEFGVAPGQAAGVITMYAIGYGVAQLIHGPLGDRLGKARYISIATMIAALASLLCAIAPGLHALELGRLLTGAIAAAIIPLAMAWIGDTVPYAQRQATLARFLNGMILGLILGQTMGGVLADTLGWRVAFALLALAFAVAGLRLNRVVRPIVVDPVSNQAGAADTTAEAHRSIATDLLDGSVARYAEVVRAPWARTILIIVALEGLFVFGVLAFVPTWLNARANVPVWASGAIVASFGLGGLLYTVNTERLLAWLGETGLSLAGGIVLAAGLALIAAWPGVASGLLACTTIGLGYHMLHNTLQTNATQMAPGARGTAVALFAMLLFIGQSIGVAVAGALIDAGRFIPVFIICCVAITALGAVFSWLIGRRHACGI